MNDENIPQAPSVDPRLLDLSVAVATAYDLQKLRIMTGNRLCASFRHKLGMTPSDAEEDQEDVIKKVLQRVRADYDLMTEGVVAVTKTDGSLAVPRSNQFKPVGCITTRGEFMLFQQYLALDAQENDHFKKTLPGLLEGFPIYDFYLNHVKGIGPAIAAIIVRYFDIHKARYPSSFWKYAGLDVVRVQDEKTKDVTWEGRSRRKAHLVPRQYENSQGETVDTVGISFQPFVKTKLMGVLAGSFLKCKSPYAQLYYDYRNRLENHPKYDKPEQKARRHQMAQRYMVKQFLVDLHANWAELEGLPPTLTYQEAKLGHVHGGEGTRQRLTNLVFPEDHPRCLKRAA